MNTCPYCKEEINEEAVKCRYCGSVVQEGNLDGTDANRYVTYILDKDLVRFVKVAGSFLAVFLLVGAFFYGFDLKQAAKEIREAQKEALDTNNKMKETAQAVAKMKKQVQLLVDDAKEQIHKIQESSKEAELIVVSLQQQHGTISQTTTVEARKIAKDISNTRVGGTKLWAVGATLRIDFLGGDRNLHEKIVRIANQWLKTANLKFDFNSSASPPREKSEIRISFKRDEGTWSFIGTDALNIPIDSPTMNFGWLTPSSSDEEIAIAVLPQFGHALGLYNEHQNPSAEIPWDVEQIKKEMSSAPNFWSEDQIEHQFFTKWPNDAFPVKKKFDPNSVMFNAYIKKWMTTEFSDRKKTTLSEGDKEFIGQLYPRS